MPGPWRESSSASPPAPVPSQELQFPSVVNADDVQAYLKGEGVEIPRERLREFLIEITSSEAFLHPSNELAITAALLDSYLKGVEKDGRRTTAFVEDISKVRMFPHVLFLGVLTRDWPGLADCTAGVVHEKGWNISFLKGVTLRYGGEELGLIIIGIKIEDDLALQAFAADREAFSRDLRQISSHSKAKEILITRNIRRLEIHSQVIERIERMYEGGDDLDRITGPDGEALKFFASRSNAYVLERTVDDLARQIITNYQFVKKVRASGGAVQIDVSNIVTTRERLTGITVAAFERDLSLAVIFEAVGKAFPGFQRKFNKEFTTADGITLYRVEVCDPRGDPANPETLDRLRKALEKAAVSKRAERARWIESIGGFEHYARAIIPFLVKEQEATQSPQVFIAAGQANEFLQEFKIIMVLPEVPGKADPLPQFFDAIDGVKGLGIVSTHPPKIMGSQRVEMLDVAADLEAFQEPEEIYALLKSRIAVIIGEFRDFDEGMRRADRTNLERVQALLPECDELVLREFYYHLDDFYRVSAPVDELATLIDLAVSAMGKSVDSRGTLEVQSGAAMVDLGSDKFKTASLIAVAYPAGRGHLRHVLQILSGYDYTMSKIQHLGTTVLTFRVMKDHRPLPDQDLDNLVGRIKGL
ncbi:MAG: hypothetical protein U0166_00225 [Acidobacteriota bacterium]